MRLMDKAFADAALPAEAERLLRAFFEQMSTFMINQAEPENHNLGGHGSAL